MIPLLSKPAENQRDWPSRAVLALCLAMLISAALTAFIVKSTSDGPSDGPIDKTQGLGTEDPRYLNAIGEFQHGQEMFAKGWGWMDDNESDFLNAYGCYRAAWLALMGQDYPDGAAPNNDGDVRGLEYQLRKQIPNCFEQAGIPPPNGNNK